MDSYFSNKYLDYLNKFIDQLKIFFSDKGTTKVLNTVQQDTNENKLVLGQNFVNNLSNENFDLFITSKIKLFSHKSNDTKQLSESLFGPELSVKQLLNNQTEEVKKTIWAYLHVIYLYSYLLLPKDAQDEEKVSKLCKMLDISDVRNTNNNADINAKIYSLLNVEVNDQTKTMIDDIVKSFNPLLDSSNPNPLGNIMQISQMISTKYSDKINNGEIELDKIMNSIKTKVPGMENIINNFGNMKNSNKPKNKVIIDQNYSTANIDVGENEDEKKSDFNIGKILKAADSLGIMPNLSKDNNTANDTTSGLPDMTTLMNMMKQLQNSNNPGLSLDMNELNKQFASVMKSNSS